MPAIEHALSAVQHTLYNKSKEKITRADDHILKDSPLQIVKMPLSREVSTIVP